MEQRQFPEADRIFRLLVEAVDGVAVAVLGPAGYILYRSTGAVRIFGYREIEVLGYSGELLFTQEDRNEGMFQRQLELAVMHGRINDGRWYEHRNGSRIWAEETVLRLRDTRGALLGFGKVMRDRTGSQRVLSAVEVSKPEHTQRRAAGMTQ